MISEIQEKWLKALESGKYEQGNGKLCKDNKYCCLGVACDVLGLKKVVGNTGAIKYFDRDGQNNANYSDSYLPMGISEEIGLLGDNGELKYQELFHEALKEKGYDLLFTNTLASYNDEGATFEQIAYAMRKVPQAVFVESE